jgi:hypothetical protein
MQEYEPQQQSRAATTKISAHETTGPPQALSTSDLMLSTTSNPRMELLLATAVFSLSMVGVESRRTEPSQPCSIYIYHKRIRFLKYYGN